MAAPLPYQCDYALSSRAACKKCRDTIPKDELRLASRVRSKYHDDFQANWYHYGCFFEKFSPASADQFLDIDIIRYEDQKRIIDSVNSKLVVQRTPKKGGKKRQAIEIVKKNHSFTVQYARSGRSHCTFCESAIPKDVVRIGKEDSKSEEALQFGTFFRWFCVKCFITCRDDLEFYDNAESMLCFEELKESDQKSLLSQIRESVKKYEVKAEEQVTLNESNSPETSEQASRLMPKDLSRKLQEQSDKFYQYVEQLKSLKKDIFEALLRANDQHEEIDPNIMPPEESRERKFHMMADALAFGLPRPCPTCKGVLRFKNFRYECTGSIDDQWVKCPFYTSKPLRTDVIIPEECNSIPFLKNYQVSSIFPHRHVEPSLKSKFVENELSNIKKVMEGVVKKEKGIEEKTEKILEEYDIGLIGRKALAFKSKVEELGGRVGKSILSSTAFAFCAEEEFDKPRIAGMKAATSHNTPILSLNFLDSDFIGQELFDAIKPFMLNQWHKTDDEVKKHLSACSRGKVIEIFQPTTGISKSANETTMIMKAGGIVHPDYCGNPNVHVLRHNGCLYSAKLHKTVVDKDTNSYYIIQILQDDFNPHFITLFRTWGRVGTENSGATSCRFDLESAIQTFKALFLEKTSNEWSNRKNFKRKYGLYYYTEDIDDSTIQDLKLDFSKSALNPVVLQLLSKLFDRHIMEQTMKEFKIDLEKMPLGKLNKKQLLEACSTLKLIGEMIDSPNLLVHSRLMSLCEKYYTLVPHSFGNRSITLLNTKKQIEYEMDMLESLLEMEIAFNIMAQKKDDNPREDPFDHHYKMLKTDLQPLDSSSEEYKMIQTYLQNTHASTHQNCKFNLNSIFTINRQGEEERFKPFENIPNRKLLWHGSRLTNFVGILSQGLRIAPPEAPASGYMFGKGVYFADSASKSANYCFHTSLNNDGLLMLSEVALGTSRELLSSEHVTKLDSQFLSVKGLGRNIPDPKDDITLDNGCVVPTGKLIMDKKNKNHSLQYNEYIVYDTAQIKQRYLLNVEFL